MNTERLAEQIAQDELNIQHEGGMWNTDEEGNDVFDADYSEEDAEKIGRIRKHIFAYFHNTDWQKIANKED